MFRKFAAGFIAVFVLAGSAQATVVITQTNNTTTLGNTLLGSGISITGASTTGDANAFGTFTNGSSVGGGFFESGIILSTGNVTDAAGPNTSDATTTDFSGAGDFDLTGLAGFDTNDAAVFEFVFTSDGGDLFFNYIFASEEYNEYTNSNFNDVFAFFVDGVNIALIPGTSDAVAINSVNGGNPLGVGASNSGLYNNNDPDDGGPFFDIEFDGFTDVFTAVILGLSAGEHTLKIAIADTSDGVLDSAVFIQAHTLSDKSPSLPEPAALGFMGLGIIALGPLVRRRRRRAS